MFDNHDRQEFRLCNLSYARIFVPIFVLASVAQPVDSLGQVLKSRPEETAENLFYDCPETGEPVFVIDLPGLVNFYGGPGGISRTTAYDFAESFLLVRKVWLRLRGNVIPGDVYAELHFSTKLDGGPFDTKFLEPVNEFDTCISVTPSSQSPTGNGSIRVIISITGCCSDLGAIVDLAELFFDAVPMPPPQSLQDFAAFQNCLHSNTDVAYCDDSDVDWDGDIDLNDLTYFLQVFDGP